MKRSIISLATLAVFLVIGGSAEAGQLTIPNSFSSGATASASQVNANFTAVETAVDDNDTRITANATAITGKLSTSGGTVSGTLNVGTLAFTGTKTHYVNVNAWEFRPKDETYARYYSWFYLYGSDTGSSQGYVAGVNLPDGAVVTAIDGYAYDNSATGDIDFCLFRVTGTGSYSTMGCAYGDSSGTPLYTTLTNSSITNNPIDNSTYSYVLYIWMYTDSSYVRFFNGRVTYTVAAPD